MSGHQDPSIIREQLQQFARTQLLADGAGLEADSPLAAAGLDSFALVELLLYCERTFGVAVPESHLTRENLASLATLADCVAALAAQVPPSREAR